MFDLNNFSLCYFFLFLGQIIGAPKLDSLELILKLPESFLTVCSAPEMQGHMFRIAFSVVLMHEVLQRLDDEISLISLFLFEGDGELEGQIILFYFAAGDQLDVLAEDRFGDHSVFGLHQRESRMFVVPVEVRVQVVVVLEQFS